VYRSNVVNRNLNPRWQTTLLDLEAACNGDLNRAMKVVVKDYRRSGGHKDMGEFETTMENFVKIKEDGGNVDENKGFKLRKRGKEMGFILVLQASVDYDTSTSGNGTPKMNIPETAPRPQAPIEYSISAREMADRPEFVDYLTGGCQISLAIAIDFTASNGDPKEEGTPHYFYPSSSLEWNDYQKAIYSVGSILAKYDSDQKFPVWGFGAKYNGKVLHCFRCGREVQVDGVEGIMRAYRGVFNTTLTMSFPTVFTEVIETAADYARHEQEEAQKEGELSYTILLILTAGNVEDVQATKAKLVEASDSPLSVVIVGIGKNDFSGMEFLDDHDPTIDGGRDITKFLKFSDYNEFSRLTEAVLDEIPNQLVDYYYGKGIMPGQAERVDKDTVEVQDADNDERTVNFLG